MAKKQIKKNKKESVKKKKKPQKKSSIKKESEKNNDVKNNSLKTFIILSFIFIVVIIAGVFFSIYKNQQLKKSETKSTVSTQYLTIKDTKTNKITKIPIKPASASGITVTTEIKPTPIQKTQKIPVKPKKQKKDFSYLFKPVKSKAEIHRIDIDEAKYLFDSKKAVFLDARSLSEYEQAHIKGALPAPVARADEYIKKYKKLLKGKVIVAYCHGVGCHLSDKVAYKVFDAGYRKIAIFFGGWPKWVQHKYPITEKQNK